MGGNCPKEYTRVLPRCPNRNYDRHDFLLVLGRTIRIDLVDKDPNLLILIQLFYSTNSGLPRSCRLKLKK